MGKAISLTENQRIDIARELFEVTSHDESRGELIGRCPIHNEKNPSFAYNYRKDTYHCLACGSTGDLIALWCHVNGRNSQDGFRVFAESYGLQMDGKIGDPNPLPQQKKRNPGPVRTQTSPAKPGEDDDSPPAPSEIAGLEAAWARMTPIPKSWVERLGQTRAWTQDGIERLGVRMQTVYADKRGELRSVAKPDAIAIPVKDRHGKLRNIRVYRPGATVGKIRSWAKGMGKARLWPNALLAFDPVILCEGEPDTICATSQGLNAVTQTSKTKYWSESHLAPFKGRHVIVAYDADRPGQQHAQWAIEQLMAVARKVQLIEWPDAMGRLPDGSWPDDHGQDLTDYFVRHGGTVDGLLSLSVDCAQSKDGAPAPETPSSALLFFSTGVNGRYSFKPKILAKRILADTEVMSDPQSGVLYRWVGTHWGVTHDNYLEQIAIEYMGDESQQGRVRDSVFQAIRMATIPEGRRVNDCPKFINVKNGRVDLETCQISDHERSDYATFHLPIDYHPMSDKRCDRFIKFLEETIQTPDVIAQVQEFAGYCLTRDVKYEKCLILLGPGSDGKSTLMSVFRNLVGPDNCAAVAFEDMEDQFLRSHLYHKLINISTEVGSKAIESSYFKAITTGDDITAAFKHQDAFTFKPYCKLIFAGNRLPRIMDNSDGLFRRFIPIRFKRQFSPGSPDYDPDLKDKLLEELSEIFVWALTGLHRLNSQRRFTMCDETLQEMKAFRRSNNPVMCFVEDVCDISKDKSIEKSTLYESYQDYCSVSGFSKLNKENFFRELYSAVANLENSRPRTPGGYREYRITGLSIRAHGVLS